MSRTQIAARLRFAAVEVDARIRWRLRSAPSFDAATPAGPFVTLVAFLPRAFAVQLADTVSALPALSEHYRYPATQLHVTIRNLDCADLTALPALLADQQPIRLQTAALGFTQETLLLGLLPTSSACTLERLRTQLDGLPGIQLGHHALRELAFVNVLRLNGPVAADLYRGVKQRRDALAGEHLELDELTLIDTDKVGTPTRSEILDRYPLPAR